VPGSVKSSEVPLETFSKVVEAIYDCALDPTRWQGTIRLIAELCRSQVCIIGVHDYANGRGELAYNLGYTDNSIRLHEEKYAAMNPFFNLILMQPLGLVTTQAMLIDDQEFWESRFYREWCKPQRFYDMINFKILHTDRRVGWWSAHRLEDQPRYGDVDVRSVTLLSPHVCRAITISDALNLKTIRSEALETTLNALTCGVYLVDRLGRIIYMNSAAERQIENGNVIRIENNRLAPIDRVARVGCQSHRRCDCTGGRNTRRRFFGCSAHERGRRFCCHHPPAKWRRTAECLWRLCRHGSDLRARPNRRASLSR
jgi:PAS domain-containing protein